MNAITTGITHNNVETLLVEAAGVELAYRRYGSPGEQPLVMLQHFRGKLDNWDLTDALAGERGVISCRFLAGDLTFCWAAQRVHRLLRNCPVGSAAGETRRGLPMATATPTGTSTITERETLQIERANESGKTPVVFIHGLWLLPSSWDNWVGLFEEAGYAGLTPSWPDDPETIEEARANPDVFAKKTLKQIADHTADVIGRLNTKPAVMAHSTGGLLTYLSSHAQDH